MKAVIVTGSRHWTDENALFTAFDEEQPDVIIHGACPTGADAMVEQYVASFTMPHERSKLPRPQIIRMPAQWDKHGRSAGPIRNSSMLEVLLILQEHGYEVAVVAAPLPDGRGTQDMMRKAEAAGIRVHRVKPNGPRTWKVWLEGYSATGECANASLVGEVVAPTFKDACVQIYDGHPNFDPDKLTFWSCRLFDNEKDARKGFG